MKSWHDFKKIRCQISTDSVSIDEKMYNEIQQDACTSINSKETNMTPEKLKSCPFDIEKAVDAFLSWPLPPSVSVDHCTTYSGSKSRIGTNLLTAIEAKQMLEYVIAKAMNTRTQSPEQGEPLPMFISPDGVKFVHQPAPSPTTEQIAEKICDGFGLDEMYIPKVLKLVTFATAPLQREIESLRQQLNELKEKYEPK